MYTGESIRRILNEKEKRKAISVNIDITLLDKVDQIARCFSKINESKNFSRNSIIELAISEYIIEAEKVLWNDYKIDICDEVEEEVVVDQDFDLVILPTYNNDKFDSAFLYDNQWYPVKISEEKIPNLKYVAIYRDAPIFGISHFASIKEIKQYNGTDKQVIIFKKTATHIPDRSEIVRLGKVNPNVMRCARYTTLEKLSKAKDMADLL